MTIVHPPRLESGDRVGIVSPSGPVTPDLLEPGLDRLRRWGLSPVEIGGVYEDAPDRPYLAGRDAHRLEALERALADDSLRALLFSRGGYGVMRLLPELAEESLRTCDTLLVGFSDLTALHLYAAGRCGLATLHGPVVKSLRKHDPGSPTSTQLRGALFGRRDLPITVDGLRPVRPGRADGRLLGGNLVLLVHLLDTPFCPDLSDAILLLEETGEEDYRLDRLLTALRLSNSAGDPAGIVLGDFTECDGAYVDDDAMADFVASLASEFDCPVVGGAPAGHGARNLPLPMGVRARLDAEAGELTVAADAVEGAPG